DFHWWFLLASCGVPGRSRHPTTLQLVADAGCQRSEQPVGLVVQAGGEVQRIRDRVERGRGEPQSPEPVDRDRPAVRTHELSLELARHGVVRVDAAVAEVADEDVAAEGAEAR